MIRSIAFVLVIIFTSLVTAYSQTIYLNPGISYSILDWRNGSSMSNLRRYYTTPLQSYAFTAGIEYFQQQNYSFSTDISFYESGGKLTGDEWNYLGGSRQYFLETDEIKNKHISLGSSFNFNPINKKFVLQLQFGPRLDYFTNSALEEPYAYLKSKNALRRFNYGITSGLSLYYNISRVRIGVNAKYLARYRPFAYLEPGYSATQGYYFGVTAEERISLFSFSLGYNFKKSKE